MTQQVKITIVQSFLMDHQTQKQCICFHEMKKKWFMVSGTVCPLYYLHQEQIMGQQQTNNYEVCYNIKFT